MALYQHSLSQMSAVCFGLFLTPYLQVIVGNAFGAMSSQLEPI